MEIQSFLQFILPVSKNKVTKSEVGKLDGSEQKLIPIKSKMHFIVKIFNNQTNGAKKLKFRMNNRNL